MIKQVAAARQAARAAHHRQALPLAIARLAGHRDLLEVELDVVGHKQIEQPVAVVIDPSAAGVPADALFVQPCFLGDVGERPVAIVVPEHVLSPVGAEQIVPAVVVVVAHADRDAPAALGQTRLLTHIRKRAIAVVLVEVGGRRLARLVSLLQAQSVRQIDVEPAVLVVVKERNPAALGLNDVFLVVYAAPDVGRRHARFLGNVHKRYR